MQPVIDRLETQRQSFDRDFSLDDTRTVALFESLQAALVAVYDAEVNALETLRRALD